MIKKSANCGLVYPSVAEDSQKALMSGVGAGEGTLGCHHPHRHRRPSWTVGQPADNPLTSVPPQSVLPLVTRRDPLPSRPSVASVFLWVKHHRGLAPAHRPHCPLPAPQPGLYAQRLQQSRQSCSLLLLFPLAVPVWDANPTGLPTHLPSEACVSVLASLRRHRASQAGTHSLFV